MVGALSDPLPACPWPGPLPPRTVEAIAPALPEPPLPFYRYLELLNRIAARVESDARLKRLARPSGMPHLGRQIDRYA